MMFWVSICNATSSILHLFLLGKETGMLQVYIYSTLKFRVSEIMLLLPHATSHLNLKTDQH